MQAHTAEDAHAFTHARTDNRGGNVRATRAPRRRAEPRRGGATSLSRREPHSVSLPRFVPRPRRLFPPCCARRLLFLSARASLSWTRERDVASRAILSFFARGAQGTARGQASGRRPESDASAQCRLLCHGGSWCGEEEEAAESTEEE